MRLLVVFPIAIYFVAVVLTPFKLCNAVEMKLTNLRCKSLNESLVKIHECRLKIVRRGVVAMNFRGELFATSSDIKINVGLYKKANGYRPFLYNTTMDFCKFKQKNSTNLFIRIVYMLIDEYSNLNHTCPYKGEVIIKNLLLEEDKFRLLPLPSGEYSFKIIVYVNGLQMTDSEVFFYRHE